ncbi:MAG: class I SAM-dependent methyltransferase, partial [Phycisphaerales bacterium]
AETDPHAPASDLLAFWATLWPSAITTAHLVGSTNLIESSTRILELGSGVGLAGLAATARGATVTLTDGDPSAIPLLERNIAHNGLADRCTAAVFRWEDPPDPLWQPDLILGCDVLYQPTSHPLLARLIRTLNCTALLTDPQRPSAASAASTFREHGLSVWETTAPPATGGCALRVLMVQAD